MKEQPVKIECPECGRDSILKRTPLYDGFKRAGERLSCVSCDLVFPDEASVPFEKHEMPKLFESDSVRPSVQVFNPGENKSLCRYCVHYVTNPFVQRCARLKKEVAATDTCGFFVSREDAQDGL